VTRTALPTLEMEKNDFSSISSEENAREDHIQ
jgi:hypothetical protein